MIKTYKFIKEIDGRWFIDLPEWDGSKDDLEMVMGADTMLDIIAQGSDAVDVTISTEKFDGFEYELTFKEHYCDGGWYRLKSQFSNFDVWLCMVTKFVFGELPQKIYLR